MTDDPITRLNAALEGRYRIERQLGEGGMATVYVARDLKHNRNVALKVLKPELAAVVGADRFLAEIETTANLQHPHILPLFDSGEADSFLFYVMPYVEGESLRERLDREHQLPVDEAVAIASKVAGALQAAHERGVIHRDVKPANILLAKGEPLVSDFGIALALGAAGAGRLTETGLSLGTPHYMSPEQATGDLSVGAATDIYALGCVLYEMLVGEPPYTGSTPQAVLGKIVTGEAPSASAERRSVPPNVDAAIRQSLEKVPADRFGSASDFSRALGESGFRHGGTSAGAATAVHRPRTRLAGIASALVIAMGAGLVWTLTRDAPRPFPYAFSTVMPEDVAIQLFAGGNLEVSPDGTMLAFVGRALNGATQVFVRPLDELLPRPLPGTANAGSPRFSPDGASIAFVDRQGDLLKTVSLAGGPTQTLLNIPRAPTTSSIAWGDDGFIYYASSGGIWRVSERGGTEESVGLVGGGEEPQHLAVLPGGRAVLFTKNLGTPSQDSVGVLLVESGEVHNLVQGAMGRYVATGHIVYAQGDGSLMAAPLDLSDVTLAGAPRAALGARIFVNVGSNAFFSVSETGVLTYLPPDESSRVPIWIDREGSEELLDVTLAGQFYAPAISGDGTRIAFEHVPPGRSDADIYVYNLEGRSFQSLTLEGFNQRPFWSSDDSEIGFSSNREGFLGLYARPADFTGSARLLIGQIDAGQAWEGVWVRGGGLLYRTGQLDGGDLMFRPSDGEPVPVVETPFLESAPSVSPDGRWVAYERNRDGRREVFARPLSSSGTETQVSEVGLGGRWPVWARNGTEIFYVTTESWAVARVRTGPTLEVVSRESFGSVGRLYTSGTTQYDVTPDGQRIIAIRQARGSDPVVMVGFGEELNRLVPVD